MRLQMEDRSVVTVVSETHPRPAYRQFGDFPDEDGAGFYGVQKGLNVRKKNIQ